MIVVGDPNKPKALVGDIPHQRRRLVVWYVNTAGEADSPHWQAFEFPSHLACDSDDESERLQKVLAEVLKKNDVHPWDTTDVIKKFNQAR